MITIDRCPSTLKPGFTSYSPAALRRVFQSKKVNHELPFTSPEDEKVNQVFMENRKRLSISGVQKKLSLILEKNKLRLTNEGEHGLYILKPIPDDLTQVAQVPANEHVTMQIAEQLFDIRTAPNALIFFQDGTPAYITRRFDYNADGTKKSMEDFATLAGETTETAGVDFKYEGSCEDLFRILKQHVGPYLIEAERLFRLILFNYTFSNGDAHLKNYSLLETNMGDSILSPAYDLMCSRLHVDDPDIAMKDGLFADGYETESHKANGFYAFDDFFDLGVRAGLPEAGIRKEIAIFSGSGAAVADLVSHSFLRDDMKKLYLDEFQNKLKRLRYSFKNQS
jgi:serine/threonine-protein kinase HipA